jgi:hypothetical protein
MLIEHVAQLLRMHDDAPLHMMLPSGEFLPAHFHITEVGRVQKTFVDCGGTRRESVSCLLQAWSAHDVDHRLKAGKLAKILKMAAGVLESDELPVEVEYGADVAARYFVSKVEVTPQGLLFVLGAKQTECLAPDKCGVAGCDTKSGCC